MSAQGRSASDAGQPHWRGRALTDAAASVGGGDGPHDQRVAFAIAVRLRDAPADHGLPALTGLLHALVSTPAPGYGTLVNVLSAVQYVLVLDDDQLGSWGPPNGSLVPLLDRALAGTEPLREQAEDLMETLTERGLVGSWLGREATRVA